jgi:hypothetical protein
MTTFIVHKKCICFDTVRVEAEDATEAVNKIADAEHGYDIISTEWSEDLPREEWLVSNEGINEFYEHKAKDPDQEILYHEDPEET